MRRSFHIATFGVKSRQTLCWALDGMLFRPDGLTVWNVEKDTVPNF